MNLRSCRDVRADLSAYLDGDLDAVPTGEIRAHLESCADCRSELDQLRLTIGALRRLPELPPPAAILTGICARLRPEPWYRRLLHGRQWPLGVPVGALATILVVIGISLFQTRSPDVTERDTNGPFPQASAPPAPEMQSRPTTIAPAAPAVSDSVANRQGARNAVERKVGQSLREEKLAAARSATTPDAAIEFRSAGSPPAEVQAGSAGTIVTSRLRVVCLLPPDGDTVDDLARLLHREGASDIEVNELEPRAVHEAFDPHRLRLAALPEPSLGWTVTASVPPRSLARLLDTLASRAGLRLLEQPAAPNAPEDPTKPLGLRMTVLR